MDRQDILKMLEEAWFLLENKLKENPVFINEELPDNSVSWHKISPVRLMGSEPYFQAALFAQIDKITKRCHKDLIVGVEGKALGSKKPDIVVWNCRPTLENLILAVELKVTGTDLTEPSNTHRGLFLSDIEKYAESKILQNGESMLFFCCYYESLPIEIISKVDKHGSLLRWLLSVSDITVTENFINSVIEGYALRGQNNWLFIDNSTL